jgi:hypothetical protein
MMKFLSISAALLLNVTIAVAQTSSTGNGQGDVLAELARMRDAMAAQQKQILEQQRQMERQQQEIESLKALSGTQGEHNQTSHLMNATLASLTPAKALVQEDVKPKESPLSFRIGGTEFTPGGFIDFENVFRTTNSGSIITTNFGAIPFSNTPQGHLTENRITAQFSRLNLKVSGRYGKNDVTAYAEMDFNGNDAGNIFVTANSHTFRERLAFVELKRNKWEFMGGQSWSWLTPNRRGVGPMPGDLALTYDEDGNAQVGIPYTRAAEFRVVYHPSDHWSAGLGIENAEQYTGFGAGEVTLPNAFAQQLASQLDPTNTNNTTPNVAPDVLSKIAYDRDLGGKHFHAELQGLLTAVKTTVQPAAGANFESSSTVGGGFGGAFNIELVKNFRLLANGFYSDGGGRYLIGLAPSVVIRSDGSPSLVHSGTGLIGLEWQPKPKTQFGAYYGVMYAQRNFTLDTSIGAKPNSFIGFGAPGSANNNNRTIQEPTFDWTQTFWRNPQYGAVMLVTQTSYLTRSPWFVLDGGPKNAHLLMVYTSFRYVLP